MHINIVTPSRLSSQHAQKTEPFQFYGHARIKETVLNNVWTHIIFRMHGYLQKRFQIQKQLQKQILYERRSKNSLVVLSTSDRKQKQNEAAETEHVWIRNLECMMKTMFMLLHCCSSASYCDSNVYFNWFFLLFIHYFNLLSIYRCTYTYIYTLKQYCMSCLIQEE